MSYSLIVIFIYLTRFIYNITISIFCIGKCFFIVGIEVSGRGELTNTRYTRKKVKYVYKCKWIIGTDKCYDWGMCYDQKRSVDLKKKRQRSDSSE